MAGSGPRRVGPAGPPGGPQLAVQVPRRKKLVGLLVYLVLVGLFFEGSARAMASSPALLRHLMVNTDAWWRLLWLQRHQPDVPIYYRFDQYHPTRGWTLAPNLRRQQGMPGNPEATVSTNSRGLRGEREFPPEPAPGRERWVVLGDSFTFGEDVSDEQTYCARLQAMRPEVDVVNLGVHGYGFDQMLLAFQEEGIRYRPRLVILGLVFGDSDRVTLGFRDYAKPRYRLENGRPVLTQVPVPKPEELLASSWAWSRIAAWGSIVAARSWGHAARYTESVELSRALIEELGRQVAATGAELVIAYLPVATEMRDTRPELTEGEAFAASLPFRVLQLRAAFRDQSIRAEGHYTAAEHELVARALSASLTPEPAAPPAR